MNVQSNVRIPSPRLNTFTNRITRNKRKKLMLITFVPGYKTQPINAHRNDSDNTHCDDVTVDNVDQTSDDNDEITTVRRITEVILDRQPSSKQTETLSFVLLSRERQLFSGRTPARRSP